MKKNDFLLISIKPKNSQSQGQLYVVRRKDVSLFVEKHLSLNNVLLIDSIDAFIKPEA